MFWGLNFLSILTSIFKYAANLYNFFRILVKKM